MVCGKYMNMNECSQLPLDIVCLKSTGTSSFQRHPIKFDILVWDSFEAVCVVFMNMYSL